MTEHHAEDRWLDGALREVVGGERPPDLATRIAARVATPPRAAARVGSPAHRGVAAPLRRRGGFGVGVATGAAAALLVAALLRGRGPDVGEPMLVLRSVDGTLEVGSAGSWQRYVRGMTLAAGDRLRTRGEGEAKVEWDGVAVLTLAPSSELEVVDMQRKDFVTGVAVGSITIACVAGAVTWQADGATTRIESGQQARLVASVSAEDGRDAELARLREQLAAAQRRIGQLEEMPARVAVSDAPAGDKRVDVAVVPAEKDVLARLNAAWPYSKATAIAKELGALPADDVLRILRGIWGEIDSAQVRQLVLWPLMKAHPEIAVQVLHLAATDRAEEVHAYGLLFSSAYAFVDFTTDPAAYPHWAQRFADRPSGEVLTTCATEWVRRLATLPAADLCRQLDQFGSMHGADGPLQCAESLGIDLGRVLRDAGMQAVLAPLVDAPDDDTRTLAWSWMAKSDVVDEDFLRRCAAPLLRDVPSLAKAPAELQTAVIQAVGRPRTSWSNATLRDALASWPVTDANRGALWDVARELARAGDQSAIPVMIGKIVAHGGEATVYGIGWFGLTPLTGVPYSNSHDGAWWLRWWDENRDRLPEAVRSLPIPRLSGGR